MRIALRPVIVSIAIAMLSAGSTARAKDLQSLPIAGDVEAFVEDSLAAIGAPAGVAVAVYTPNGVYARGFGLADVSTAEPATADTAFYIASSTKSFVALSMQALHHRGEIDLDASLADFDPDASFPPAVHPGDVKLRDLLSHTSGIENNGIVFRSAYSGEHTPELLWDLLGESAPNRAAPHGVFEYANTGYNLLTILTDRKLGVRWQDLIDREIIAPAGMTHTTAYMSRAKREGWSIARPHGPVAEGPSMRVLDLEKVDATMHSAGGMIMSANDALLWLELLVNDGRVGGRQVVPLEAVRETRSRLVSVDRKFGPYLREAYGLGWYVSTYRDDLMIHHFGSFPGFRAHVSYLPERRVGVAVFVNEAVAGSLLADVTANYIYDRLAGREAGEAVREKIIADVRARHQAIMDRIATDLDRRVLRTWRLSLPRDAYAGVYHSPALGTLELALDGDDLIARLGVMQAVVEPFDQPDMARVELAPLSGTVLAFQVENRHVLGVTLSGPIEGTFTRRRPTASCSVRHSSTKTMAAGC